MKKSNKILAVLLALVMILVAVPTAMAEEAPENVQPGEGTDVTCTEGHAWDEGAVTTEPTCTEAGVKTYTCTVCEETKTEEVPAAHKFDEVIDKNAETHTCQCSVCGKDNVAEAHAWDEGTVTTEPTCDATGVKTYTCTVCEETKTEEVPATHKFDEVIDKNAETHTYQCSVCGKDNVAEAHTWDEGTVTKETTCKEAGVKEFKCACGETKTEEIPMIAEHTWNDGEVTTEATCTEAGVKTYTCSVCGETKTEEIPAAHKFDEVIDKNAETHTCQCSVCGKDNVAEAHAWDEGTVTTEPTCDATGVKTYTCTVCEETKTEEVPMLEEHTWDEGVETTAPTCTEAGVKTYTCSVCEATKTEEIPAAHKFDELLVKDAETHTYQCSVCGKDGEAEAHTWDEGTVTTEPSCEEAGVKTFECACGETKTEEVPALGEHDWDEWVVILEPTTEKPGIKTRMCKNCDDVEIEEIEKLEEAEPIPGDVDNNGKVSAIDARLVLQYVAGLETLTEEQMAVADVDGNGKVSAVDARYILQMVAGLIK